jgi:hypothetical protein
MWRDFLHAIDELRYRWCALPTCGLLDLTASSSHCLLGIGDRNLIGDFEVSLLT